MSNLQRRSLVSIVIGLLVLILAPAGLAQVEAQTDATIPAVEPGPVIDVPTPAVKIVPQTPAEPEQAWTFRYLIPTSLVIALLVVVGSIVAYFLKVVRTRYRLIQ
ncbi:MAG: hypothetical protein OEM84_10270 [Acidimicrobiia bacterium]|nr:hypothetical protein [Acidimicrobiia bacterium]